MSVELNILNKKHTLTVSAELITVACSTLVMRQRNYTELNWLIHTLSLHSVAMGECIAANRRLFGTQKLIFK